MRALLFLFLALPLIAVGAEDDFETKLSELHKGLETKLMHARKKHDFKSYPNDKFIEEYNQIISSHVDSELKLYQDHCKSEGDKACLSDKEVEEKKAQFRIVSGLENRKNDWAKEGVSEENIDEKISAYNDCHDKKEDCDKLSEADRKIASEEAFESRAEGKSSSKSELKSQDKAETRNVSRTTITTKASVEETSEVQLSIVADKKTETKVEAKEADAKKDEKKEEKKPEKKAGPQSSEEVKDQKKEEKGESKKEDKKADKKEDKKDEPAKVDDPEVIEVSDDEKTPRNYKPESCRWVNDLPRKVVNGPGCGPKNRSMICTGYVICEQKQGGAKFIRMSTCAADKCGSSDEDAVRCTKDMGYFSMRPQGETKLFMTPALKKILSNGASRQ